MEEILHHVGCLKPYTYGINHPSTGAGVLSWVWVEGEDLGARACRIHLEMTQGLHSTRPLRHRNIYIYIGYRARDSGYPWIPYKKQTSLKSLVTRSASWKANGTTLCISSYYIWLVVSTILKNMISSMGRMTSYDIPYMKWKIKFMFETNQTSYCQFDHDTLWLFNSSPWYRWSIEIDGLPINSMVIFHGELFVSHNQRVKIDPNKKHQEFSSRLLERPRILRISQDDPGPKSWQLTLKRHSQRLVVEPTPLKNMSSSVGMMTFPIWWKNNPNVPNHQLSLGMRG